MSEAPYRATDRRPIAARSWGISLILTRWLARSGVSPNTISLTGMVAGLAAGACLSATSLVDNGERFLWLAAALLVVLRLLANMLDGMVALETGKASAIGELFNEIPDRISDVAILIGLGYARGGSASLGFLAALAAMMTAYIRAVGKIAGAPQYYSGPMAKQQRMLLVIVLGACGLFAPEFVAAPIEALRLAPSAIVLVVIVLGCALTSLRRLRQISSSLQGRSR